ncbi:hypothetical protein MTO96_002868 [Rhipicephalus appendiculatus]
MSQQGTLSSQDTPQRKAAPRFTEDEKNVLITLVREFKHIIECKKTDVASTAKKNQTWTEIAKRYNANHGITRRDHLQLKKCWNNLKQKWKEETAREKRERHKTGGGPAPSAMAPIYQLVGSIAGHMATRVENAFDSDGTDYQPPPLASLPVVRLLQPMIDGPSEADFDCQGFQGAGWLFWRTLAAENEIRAELLREEHAIRVRLLQEDHDDMILERADKRKFDNQVRELELLKHKNELEKQKLEIEILQIEKELKNEQLRRLQCSASVL